MEAEVSVSYTVGFRPGQSPEEGVGEWHREQRREPRVESPAGRGSRPRSTALKGEPSRAGGRAAGLQPEEGDCVGLSGKVEFSLGGSQSCSQELGFQSG